MMYSSYAESVVLVFLVVIVVVAGVLGVTGVWYAGTCDDLSGLPWLRCN